MEVILKPVGFIEKFFPEKEIRLELANTATLADLYQIMGQLYGSDISAAVWNHKKSRFRGPVSVSADGRLLIKDDECLYDGQIIVFKRFLIGG